MELSFEFFPPKTEEGLAQLLKHAETFTQLKPNYFSVTFGAGGSTREHTPNTVFSIFEKTNIPTVPHISCMGLSKAELLSLMNYYQEKGIRRLLVLRGDKPSGSGVAGDFKYASDLVYFIREHFGDTFYITVSAYPETHPESKDMATELHHFKLKAQAGANSSITQYFYNPDAYFYFCERARKMGVTIPITPGIMPILNLEKLKRFSSFCGAEIPRWILRQLEAYEDPEDVKKFGIEVITHLCEALKKGGAPGFHFYTLNLLNPSVELATHIKG